jgi:acetyl esterase/lipase
MVAIVADYRVKTRQNAKPADCVSDAKACVRWVRANAKRLGIDPQRIAVGGGSAGGHLAASTATLPGLDPATDDKSVPPACPTPSSCSTPGSSWRRSPAST